MNDVSVQVRGAAVKVWRRAPRGGHPRGFTLWEMHEATKHVDPSGRGIALSSLGLIENGKRGLSDRTIRLIVEAMRHLDSRRKRPTSDQILGHTPYPAGKRRLAA